MQAALVLVAIVGTTAWLAVDASKRDWTGNGFAKNVPTWVIGSLLLWVVVFPMYVFVHRKKAPLRDAEPEPEPAERRTALPLAAVRPELAAGMPAPLEDMRTGPSLEELRAVARLAQADPEDEVEAQPEPLVEIKPEPVVEIQPAPMVEIEPDPAVAISEAVVEIQPEPLVEIQPEPLVEIQPEPVVEIQPEPVAETSPLPAVEIQPEPVAETPSVPAVEIEPLEITHPEPAPAEGLAAADAPPGLSLDAFKDIKPVSFGTTEADETVAPTQEALTDDATPAASEEPVHSPVAEPAAMPEAEAEPADGTDTPSYEPDFSFQPLDAGAPTPSMRVTFPSAASHPADPPADDLPADPAAAVLATEADAPAEKPAGRRRRIPNPQLKLPSISLRRKRAPLAVPVGADLSAAPAKKSFLALPPSLQGPLTDVERKIALGSVVAVLAAAAFGYTSAPVEEASAPNPAPAPAAASR